MVAMAKTTDEDLLGDVTCRFVAAQDSPTAGKNRRRVTAMSRLERIDIHGCRLVHVGPKNPEDVSTEQLPRHPLRLGEPVAGAFRE